MFMFQALPLVNIYRRKILNIFFTLHFVQIVLIASSRNKYACIHINQSVSQGNGFSNFTVIVCNRCLEDKILKNRTFLSLCILFSWVSGSRAMLTVLNATINLKVSGNDYIRNTLGNGLQGCQSSRTFSVQVCLKVGFSLA